MFEVNLQHSFILHTLLFTCLHSYWPCTVPSSFLHLMSAIASAFTVIFRVHGRKFFNAFTSYIYFSYLCLFVYKSVRFNLLNAYLSFFLPPFFPYFLHHPSFLPSSCLLFFPSCLSNISFSCLFFTVSIFIHSLLSFFLLIFLFFIHLPSIYPPYLLTFLILSLLSFPSLSSPPLQASLVPIIVPLLQPPSLLSTSPFSPPSSFFFSLHPHFLPPISFLPIPLRSFTTPPFPITFHLPLHLRFTASLSSLPPSLTYSSPLRTLMTPLAK